MCAVPFVAGVGGVHLDAPVLQLHLLHTVLLLGGGRQGHQGHQDHGGEIHDVEYSSPYRGGSGRGHTVAVEHYVLFLQDRRG